MNLALIFRKSSGYHDYSESIFDLKDISEDIGTFYLPLETDTEFHHPSFAPNNMCRTMTRTITVQHKGVYQKSGRIFDHPDSPQCNRHIPFKSEFSVVDFLRAEGYQVEFERKGYHQSPRTLQIDSYGHFLIADFNRTVQGGFRADIDELILKRRDDRASISMERRLIAQSVRGQRIDQFVVMPWVMTIDGVSFQVAISYYDTCAVQGFVSLLEFAANSGVDMPYKNLFNKNHEKSRMHIMYHERPEDFDNYALGDLVCHQALMGNLEMFRQIYKELDLEEYFEPPRLTIGATVARLVKASLLKHCGYNPNEATKIAKLCEEGTAQKLLKKSSTTLYNAKVDGGRCWNAKPRNVSLKAPIADADMTGCYVVALINQQFPIGRPAPIEFPIDSDRNDYPTLGKVLKEFRGELVPGLWQMRVSLRPGYRLKYEQDYLVSWYPPKDVSKMPCDTNLQAVEWWTEDNIGITKILTESIHKAVITEEFLEWLDCAASEKQRAELLDNLLVESGLLYPACERRNTIGEVLEAQAIHKGKNKWSMKARRGKTKIIKIEEECHAWYGVNLGDLLVTKLKEKREEHPDKSPMNVLYKLCGNTVYGVMVSPFFDISNVVVGNNITATARSMAWCMEKALGLFQTITDGGAFELNKVVYGKGRRLTAVSIFRTDLPDRTAHYSLRPIGGCDRIENWLDNGRLGLIIHKNGESKMLDNESARKWVANSVSEHIQQTFPNFPVTKLFQFKIKDIFDGIATQGASNYKFSINGETEKGAMRSYKKDEFEAYTMTGDDLQRESTDYKASEVFLEDLLNNPSNVSRGLPFLNTKILKIGEYRGRYNTTWKESEAYPGCTVENVRVLNECSLSQFHYKDIEQFKSWEREAKKKRELTGQTYETYYLNPDGTLDMQRMVKDLDERISRGDKSFKSGCNRAERKGLPNLEHEHPHKRTKDELRRQLAVNRYGFSPEVEYGLIDDSEEFDDIESDY